MKRKRKRSRKKTSKGMQPVQGIAVPSVALVKYVPPERTRLEIVQAICERIVNGARVHVACHDEGITWKTLFFWKAADDELGTLYARAREASAESWEDKASEVAELSKDFRLQEDNARWRAKMANPRKFSDRQDAALDSLERIGLEALLAGAYRQRVGGT